jgi:hypothetical protein
MLTSPMFTADSRPHHTKEGHTVGGKQRGAESPCTASPSDMNRNEHWPTRPAHVPHTRTLIRETEGKVCASSSNAWVVLCSDCSFCALVNNTGSNRSPSLYTLYSRHGDAQNSCLLLASPCPMSFSVYLQSPQTSCSPTSDAFGRFPLLSGL